MSTDDLIARLRAMARREHDDLGIAGEAADEIERLRGIVQETLERLNDDLCAENERLHACLHTGELALAAAEQRAEKAEQERDALRADAERFRWIDEHVLTVDMVGGHPVTGRTLREAVDAAKKVQP